MSVPASPAVVTPDELEELLGVSSDDAERVATLVQITVEAYLWPAAVPDPVPPPIHAVGLALGGKFAGASLSSGGAVVGESIGSYSYRLASPLTYDSVIAALGPLGEALWPWAPWRSGVFSVNIGPAPLGWPADWWQRDLDNALAALDAAVAEVP